MSKLAFSISYMVDCINSLMTTKRQYSCNKRKLSENPDFKNMSETEFLLLKRFINRRDQLFDSYQMFSSTEAHALMKDDRSAKSVASQFIRKCIEKNEIIAFKHLNKFLVPAFQFDTTGHLIDVFQDQLTIINSYEIDHLDFCFWLTEKRTVTLRSPRLPVSFSGFSYKESMKFTDEQVNNSINFDDLPLNAAKAGMNEVFSMLVDEWLHTDTYDIFLGKSI